jgi:exosome complex exonuclease RRP6
MEQWDRHRYELNKFSPDTKFLTVKHELPHFQPVSSTPFIMVDTTEAFEPVINRNRNPCNSPYELVNTDL